MRKLHTFSLSLFTSYFAFAAPLREWDWHMPAEVYRNLEFTDRASVDRAVTLFQRAIDAENRGTKVTDLVSMYRGAAGEWRKVQVQAETSGADESLLAYAVFMQGYGRQQAHDRNEAMKLFGEVLDLYPEQKFVAIPARYMLYVIKREMGDVRQANAELEEIASDKAADGHKVYYNVVRSLATARLEQGLFGEAADLLEKVVFSKGRVDGNLRATCRDELVMTRLASLDFGRLEPAVLALCGEGRKERRDELLKNVAWFWDLDRYNHHAFTQYLNRLYPDERRAAKRKDLVTKIRKGYAGWIAGEGSVFEGLDDGWAFDYACFRAAALAETPDKLKDRVARLENRVKGSKPDDLDARASALARTLATLKMAEAARRVASAAKETATRLRLQYEVESAMGEWKLAAMFLEELVNVKPAPADGVVRSARYDLASVYRWYLRQPEKAVVIYGEINDPPRSLWGLAEAQREANKKTESYKTLTEIASMFPNDAAEAVFRMAQWKEADGDKERAITLYRRILKHPQWKQSGASSRAHQELERLGIATGGAMTNEVR